MPNKQTKLRIHQIFRVHFSYILTSQRDPNQHSEPENRKRISQSSNPSALKGKKHAHKTPCRRKRKVARLNLRSKKRNSTNIKAFKQRNPQFKEKIGASNLGI